MNKISRKAKPYREIELFEDYELTYCCMYEMAIRSPWFDAQLQEIIDLYEKYDPDSDNIIEINENVFNGITEPSIYSLLMDKVSSLGLREYIGYPLKGTQKLNDVLEIVKTLDDEELPYINSHDSYTTLERVTTEKKTYIRRYLERDGCSIENNFAIDEWLLKNDIEPGFFHGNGSLKAKEILADLMQRDLMGMVNKNISIHQKLKRPYLKLFQMHGLMTSIDLDFSLPKHELLSYVSLIKDHLDADYSIVAPVELLDKELTELFSFSLLENKKGQKQIKLATMFYIYDAFKQGMKQSQIKQEVSYYNGANIDERTIKGYYNIMKKLIDEENYKHLTRFIELY